MTKDEVLKMTLEALEADPLEMVADVDGHMVFLKDKAITAIKEALAQTQEPVAWGVFEGNLHDMFFSPSEAQEMADLKGTHAEVRPLYTTPPALAQPEQEPVAWQVMVEDEAMKEFSIKDMARDWCVQQKLSASPYAYWIRPLYTTPPQRKPQYDKTEMNCFVQDLYDKKMQEGKHGHYETMFHVVHRAIEAAHGIKE